MGIKVIITGATGYVGEGVLLECLDHPNVDQVLMVNRKTYPKKHPKLKECIIPDFMKSDDYKSQLTGYDACFFCAGISSVGMTEKDYSHITYELTMSFANSVQKLNPQMTFIYVSGAMTDSTEKGKIMWARVKGRTENALMRMPFKKAYNFRPGFMKATPGMVNIKPLYKIIGSLSPVIGLFFPKQMLTLREVALAMIHCVIRGYSKSILEINDIREASH